MAEPELVHTTVEGRPATLAYFDKNFIFTTPDKATLVKIIYNDTGERVFAVIKPPAAATDYDPDQPRNEKGEWSSGEGGRASLEQLSKENIRGRLQTIFKNAVEAKSMLDTAAQHVAEKVGGVVARTPLKKIGRAVDKIHKEYGGDIKQLTDVARNTIVVPPGKEETALGLLKSEACTLGCKAKVIKPGDDPMGYTGMNVKVRTKAGITGEIQINTPAMIYGKELEKDARDILGNKVYDELRSRPGMPVGGRGHELYAQARDLAANDPRLPGLWAESLAYYNSVRKAA